MNDRTRAAALITVSIVFAVAIVLFAVVLSQAFVRTHTADEVIHVTGSAQQPIRSDFIIWDSTITDEATTVSAAYAALHSQAAKLDAYLVSKGITRNEITISSITTTTLYVPVKGAKSSQDSGSDGDSDKNEGVMKKVAGYRLDETFEVRSNRVDLVDAVSRESTELISAGVPLESSAPSYLYTKLGDLKVKMLALAAQDARNRAEQIAQSTGSSIAGVRNAHMGVLQIEPLYSGSNDNQISDSGTNDTSSLDKKIIAVVTADFAVR